jgi:hypothetical protein
MTRSGVMRRENLLRTMVMRTYAFGAPNAVTTNCKLGRD